MRNLFRFIYMWRTMMWKLLIGLIYALGEISSSGDCAPEKRKFLKSSKATGHTNEILVSDVRAKRQKLEEQHRVNYLANEDMYRNWPEVHDNPKYYCQNFLKEIFTKKRNSSFASSVIQKVILNYTQMRDENNKIPTAKRVTALECQLSKPMWRRRYLYFIRSPQFPECVLFLNRIGKRSFNFYIIEEICENKRQPIIRRFMKELQEDKPDGIIQRSSRSKRRMFMLPDDEIKVKHAEYEQRHYEYCLSDPDMCKLWPEVQMNPNIDCQRFLKIMLPKNKNLSLITAGTYLATLHYMDIKDKYELNEGQDTIEVNTILCKLPDPVRKRKYVHFIRAPSYPNCVFYITKKMALFTYFSIDEEICATFNYKTSLYRIILENEQGTKYTKMMELLEYETFEKVPQYEWQHFQKYSLKHTEYEEWPELQEMDIKSYCQTIVKSIFRQIVDTHAIDKMFAKLHLVELKYATMSLLSAKTIPPRKVKALECLISAVGQPNQFFFIRSPEPNCVYLIRWRYGRQIYYFITRKFCKDNAEVLKLQGTDSL